MRFAQRTALHPAEGARLVRDLAALSAIAKLDNPLRFTSPNGSGAK